MMDTTSINNQYGIKGETSSPSCISIGNRAVSETETSSLTFLGKFDKLINGQEFTHRQLAGMIEKIDSLSKQNNELNAILVKLKSELEASSLKRRIQLNTGIISLVFIAALFFLFFTSIKISILFLSCAIVISFAVLIISQKIPDKI